MGDSQPVILIVDDEDIIRESLELFLEDEGFYVLTALSGEMGLTLLERNKVDLAVVDIRLPGMSGNDFILRAHALRPSLRYIVHTGSTEYKLPGEVREIGIDDEHVFIKPVTDMSRFLSSLHSLMAGESV